MKETKQPNNPLPVEPNSSRKNTGGSKEPNPYARIKIKEAMNSLLIKDFRTFRKWAEKWQVTIYEGIGGRFLLANEFEQGQRMEIEQQQNGTIQLPIQSNLKRERRIVFKATENLSEEARKFKEYLNKKIG